MTVREAINRGNNLLAVAVVVFLGFVFIPEFFMEASGYSILMMVYYLFWDSAYGIFS